MIPIERRYYGWNFTKFVNRWAQFEAKFFGEKCNPFLSVCVCVYVCGAVRCAAMENYKSKKLTRTDRCDCFSTIIRRNALIQSDEILNQFNSTWAHFYAFYYISLLSFFFSLAVNEWTKLFLYLFSYEFHSFHIQTNDYAKLCNHFQLVRIQRSQMEWNWFVGVNCVLYKIGSILTLISHINVWNF